MVLSKKGCIGKYRDCFELMYHPDKWELDTEYGWLPTLVPVTASARGNMRNKGWQSVELGDPRLGDDAYYLTTYEVGTRPIYVTKWEQPRLLGGLTKWTKDREGYFKFLKALVDNGVIPNREGVKVAPKAPAKPKAKAKPRARPKTKTKAEHKAEAMAEIDEALAKVKGK